MNKFLFIFIILIIVFQCFSQTATPLVSTMVTESPTPMPDDTPSPVPTPIPPPFISSVIPATGPEGTETTITGTSFVTYENKVIISSLDTTFTGYTDIYLRNALDNQTINFTIPTFINPSCHYDTPPCPAPSLRIRPGEYEIRVENNLGMSNPVTFIVTDPDPQAVPTPPPPENLKANSVSTDKLIIITWEASAGAECYNVKRGTKPAGPYETIASCFTGIRYEDADTALVPGSEYYYVISSVNEYGESPNTSQVRADANEPSPSPDPDLTPSPTLVIPVALTINIINPGWVVADPPGITIHTFDTPAQIAYESGTTVNLSVIVPTPWPCGSGCIQPAFLGWEGDPVTDGSILMDSDKTVTAVFRDFSSAPTPEATPYLIIGDVDSSGSVDIIDALVTAQFYVGLEPTNFNQAAADVDCSGSVDIIDALLIAQYYVGLMQTLGC